MFCEKTRKENETISAVKTIFALILLVIFFIYTIYFIVLAASSESNKSMFSEAEKFVFMGHQVAAALTFASDDDYKINDIKDIEGTYLVKLPDYKLFTETNSDGSLSHYMTSYLSDDACKELVEIKRTSANHRYVPQCQENNLIVFDLNLPLFIKKKDT